MSGCRILGSCVKSLDEKFVLYSSQARAGPGCFTLSTVNSVTLDVNSKDRGDFASIVELLGLQ